MIEKSLIECPSESKCSDTLVIVAGKCLLLNFYLFFGYIFAEFDQHIVVVFVHFKQVIR
jgi:hypothetical protein